MPPTQSIRCRTLLHELPFRKKTIPRWLQGRCESTSSASISSEPVTSKATSSESVPPELTSPNTNLYMPAPLRVRKYKVRGSNGPAVNVDNLLKKPTWSVRSLLPTSSSNTTTSNSSPKSQSSSSPKPTSPTSTDPTV